MGTGVRLACITHGGPRPRGAGNEPLKPSRWTSGGLEPCRCSRPARDAAPTIATTIFWSDRLAADAGPGRRSHRRPSMCWPWSTISPARPSMCWSWSTSSPASTNQARCPRCARFRGDRRETGATGRAERPSKWRGSPWVPCQLARPRPM